MNALKNCQPFKEAPISIKVGNYRRSVASIQEFGQQQSQRILQGYAALHNLVGDSNSSSAA